MKPGARILTWNVFHCRDGRRPPAPTAGSVLLGRPVVADGYAHLNRKLTAEIGAVLSAVGADALMLQEVPPLAIAALARAAGMTTAWSVRTGPHLGGVHLRGRLGERNPDLWKTHEGNANVLMIGPRLRALGPARALRLNPVRRIVPESLCRGLPARELARWLEEPRRAVAASVALPDGTAVTLVCAHMHGARNAWQSAFEIGRLARWLGGTHGPVVLGGDLNVGADDPVLAILRDAGLGRGQPAGDLGLDRVLVRGLRLTAPERRWDPRERTVTIEVDGVPRYLRLSDHDPVEAVVEGIRAT